MCSYLGTTEPYKRLCEGEHMEESEARYKNQSRILKMKATANHLKRHARVCL